MMLRAVWNKRHKELNLTQEKAAQVLGISQSAINQYLLGTTPLNLAAGIRFADLLKVPLGDINPEWRALTVTKLKEIGSDLKETGRLVSIELKGEAYFVQTDCFYPTINKGDTLILSDEPLKKFDTVFIRSDDEGALDFDIGKYYGNGEYYSYAAVETCSLPNEGFRKITAIIKG